ncbi:MAG: hypothetical protein ABFD98_03000 [Syntrophobacteraceae bacterium]
MSLLERLIGHHGFSCGRFIRWAALLLLAVAGVFPCGDRSARAAAPAFGPANDRGAVLPPTMLWAWERNEDLGFLDVRTAGVAFLSRRCLLRGEETIVRRRRQPLKVPPGCVLEAVIRIESDGKHPPLLSAGQMERVIREVAEASAVPGVKAVQIDFDARLSQRTFYREMLRRTRDILPDSMPLSITALASWCMYDDWVSGLPVDQVVPMLFRMGLDGGRIRSDIRRRGEFLSSACRRAIGICTDEPVSLPLRGKRTYIFHPRRWTEDSFRSRSQEVAR